MVASRIGKQYWPCKRIKCVRTGHNSRGPSGDPVKNTAACRTRSKYPATRSGDYRNTRTYYVYMYIIISVTDINKVY